MNLDIYSLLTLGLLVVLVAAVIVVGLGLFISGRRERAETVAAAPVTPVATPIASATTPAGGFFADVESSSTVIVEAARENTVRGRAYVPENESEPYDL